MVVTASPASAMCDALSSAICRRTCSSRSTGSARCDGQLVEEGGDPVVGDARPSSWRVETGTSERRPRLSGSSPRSQQQGAVAAGRPRRARRR